MSKSNIFEFTDYKDYIKSWIETRPNGGRGEKSKISKTARCHLAYVSQVLTGNSDFSLEQAESLNQLFEHGENEAHFFLLLVELGRAGTPSLQNHFKKQIKKILNERLLLKNRFTYNRVLDSESQAIYYGHWAYCAIHMAILNPDLRTPGPLAHYFDLPMPKIVEILEFLSSVGIAKKEGGIFLPGDARLHLGVDSPLLAKHHTNWRMQTIRSLERETPHELHYSGVISVSKDHLPKIREVMVKAMEEVRLLVKDANDETVYYYGFDLFGLGKD